MAISKIHNDVKKDVCVNDGELVNRVYRNELSRELIPYIKLRKCVLHIAITLTQKLTLTLNLGYCFSRTISF